MKTEAHTYIPEDVELPKMYSTENVSLQDKVLHIKLFTPDSNWTWYIAEYDPKTKIAFGYVRGFEAEWGDFSLEEIAEVRGALGLPIERDLYFKPTKFSELRF
jgi:hypothetical protein